MVPLGSENPENLKTQKNHGNPKKMLLLVGKINDTPVDQNFILPGEEVVFDFLYRQTWQIVDQISPDGPSG